MAQDSDAASNPDWSAQTTDSFIALIDSVKTKSTGPLLKAVRALVHGFLIMTIGLAALVLFIVGAIRLVNSYLPEDVWAAHLLLGTIFLLGGFFVWSKRRP